MRLTGALWGMTRYTPGSGDTVMSHVCTFEMSRVKPTMHHHAKSSCFEESVSDFWREPSMRHRVASCRRGVEGDE